MSTLGTPTVPYAPGPSPPTAPLWTGPAEPPRRRRPIWVPWLAVALAAVLVIVGVDLALSRAHPPAAPSSDVELTTEALVDVLARASSDGTVYLLCSTSFYGGGSFVLYQTNDGGTIWTNQTLSSIPSAPPSPILGTWSHFSLLAYATGLVIVLGSGELVLPADNATQEVAGRPEVAYDQSSIIEAWGSTDGGAAWSGPWTVQEFNASIDSLSAANDGEAIVVAWSTYNETSGLLEQQAAFSESGGQVWTEPQNLTQLGPGSSISGGSVVQVVVSDGGFDLTISGCGPDCSTDAPSFVAYAPFASLSEPNPFYLIATWGPWSSPWLTGGESTGAFLLNTSSTPPTIAPAGSVVGPEAPFPGLPAYALLSTARGEDGSTVLTGGSEESLVISSWNFSGGTAGISAPSNVTVILPAPWAGWTPELVAIVATSASSWVAAYEWFHCPIGPVAGQCKGPSSALLLVGYPLSSAASDSYGTLPTPSITTARASYVRLRGSP